VHAVYVLCDSQVSTKTGSPLFIKAKRGRANNVLGEIMAGYAADPPGVQFYYQSHDAKGAPSFDEHSIALLD
jgi:hypothetical protein